MPYFSVLFGYLSPDTLSRRIWSNPVWMVCFQVQQLSYESIVLGIRYTGLI